MAAALLQEEIIQISIYSADVLLQDAEDILCGICNNICNKPMDVGCEKAHVYCEPCLNEYIQNESSKKGNITCIACKDKSVIIDKQMIIHNKFAEKQINKLNVQCPYSNKVQTKKTKGSDDKEQKQIDYDEGMNVEDTRQKDDDKYCKWTGLFGQLLDHINNECKFKKMFNKIQCEYYKYGCNQEIKESEIDKHMEENKMKHLELKMDYRINEILVAQKVKVRLYVFHSL